jgi:hypothetical protein
MVGFSNRQSFYASFFKMMKMTPRQFRLQHLALHPGEVIKPAKPAKAAKVTKKTAKKTAKKVVKKVVKKTAKRTAKKASMRRSSKK